MGVGWAESGRLRCKRAGRGQAGGLKGDEAVGGRATLDAQAVGSMGGSVAPEYLVSIVATLVILCDSCVCGMHAVTFAHRTCIGAWEPWGTSPQ